MRQVKLREDDVKFSTLVREVEAAESVTLVRSGRPVAQIVPFPEAKTGLATAERVAAMERLKAIMDKGYDLGIVWNGRDELYERG